MHVFWIHVWPSLTVVVLDIYAMSGMFKYFGKASIYPSFYLTTCPSVNQSINQSCIYPLRDKEHINTDFKTLLRVIESMLHR